MVRKKTTKKNVETLTHEEASRKNIPTAEYQTVMQKDEQDWSDLVVHVPPLYIQEKVHPKVLIEECKTVSEWLSDRDSEMRICCNLMQRH